jgi:PhnB protein
MTNQGASMTVTPYLNFEGRTEEAIEFYKKTLGAQVDMLMRHSDSPDKPPPGMIPPGSESKIMHSSFRIGESVIMATDGSCTGKGAFQGISLSLKVADAAEANKVFDSLASGGGQVQMPLMKTFFSPAWGMVADKFGVSWMVVVM